MSQSMIARMRVMLSGNVASEARKTGRNFEAMATRSQRAMARMRAGATSLDRGIGVMTNRFAGLAAGLAGAGALRNAMSAEERLERLGVAAGKSSEDMKQAMTEIRATAAEEDIRIDPKEILAGIEAIQEKVGDFDLAHGLRREIGLAIQATGSGGQEIGALVASIAQKFDIETPEGMRQALDLLTVQGKEGAVELSNLARLGPKVFAVYGSFGKKGVAGLAEAGGLMQIFMRGVGSAEQAATVFENVFNTMGDATKIAKLKKLGVAVEDETGKMKKPVELLKTIIEAAGGDDMKLGAVFDAESLRGIRQISRMLRENGGFEELDAIINVKADGTTIEGDSARIAKTASAAYDTALAKVEKNAQELLAEPMRQLADAINGIDTDEIVFTAKGLTAALVAYKGVKVGLGAYSALRPGRAALGGAAGLASLAKPMPVFVTNPGFGKGMGGALGQAGKTTAAAATGAAAGGSSVGALAATAGRVAPPVLALTIIGGALRAGTEDTPRGDPETRRRMIEATRAQNTERYRDRTAIARRFSREHSRGDGAALPGQAETQRPSNPARAALLQSSQTGAEGGSFIDGLIGAGSTPSLPQSAPLSDDRAIEVLEDIAEEGRETRQLLEDMSRVQPAFTPYPQSTPGNVHRIMGQQ